MTAYVLILTLFVLILTLFVLSFETGLVEAYEDNLARTFLCTGRQKAIGTYFSGIIEIIIL